jgi:hypothetical protein
LRTGGRSFDSKLHSSIRWWAVCRAFSGQLQFGEGVLFILCRYERKLGLPPYPMLVNQPTTYFSLETPKTGSGPTNLEAEPPLAGPSVISLGLPQHVQGPNTVPQHAGEKHRSTPFGTVEPTKC